jgi:predicted nucleic acid-binding Zn ribbon protein
VSEQRRRRPPDTLRPAGELLAGLLAQLGLADRLREQEALARWPELVGPEIASRSRALRIREGVLYVQVTSAAWSQELRFLKAQILAHYDEALSPGLVKDIRFTQH